MEKETVEMWKAKGRLGATILKEDYDAIKHFIFSILHEKEAVELQELLNEAHNNLSAIIKRDFTLQLLEVKQDLEVKGLINVTRQANRVQFISSIRKNSKDRSYAWGTRSVK